MIVLCSCILKDIIDFVYNHPGSFVSASGSILGSIIGVIASVFISHKNTQKQIKRSKKVATNKLRKSQYMICIHKVNTAVKNISDIYTCINDLFKEIKPSNYRIYNVYVNHEFILKVNHDLHSFYNNVINSLNYIFPYYNLLNINNKIKEKVQHISYIFGVFQPLIKNISRLVNYPLNYRNEIKIDVKSIRILLSDYKFIRMNDDTYNQLISVLKILQKEYNKINYI